MVEALDIIVRGIVQGVGFRPFVYKLAKRYLVNGWVLNNLDGVFIHAEAESQLIDEFVTELHTNPPSSSKISEIELKEVPLQDCITFEIRESHQETSSERTLVSADLGICDDCVRELFNVNDRRFRYPFINCTNCGPRFTIIDSLPYDRPATSMHPFTMCNDCASEYSDPRDRRFHAQPNACFKCGPHITWSLLPTKSIKAANSRSQSDAIIAEAVNLLEQGGILAVKGLGGFHLVCDGNNPSAITKLRQRKQRNGKPFAVLAVNIEAARKLCEISETEERLLESAARPIVLLRKRTNAVIAKGLANGLSELGVMLASTPVQALLAHDYYEKTGSELLVMTSGNIHDNPIVTDDTEALTAFDGIADAILGNNRTILSRYDDSVVRIVKLGNYEALQFIRRARGYAPIPLAISKKAKDFSQSQSPVIFATGSEQKNTFTYLRNNDAFVSQHIGDLEDAAVNDAWLESKARFTKLFEISPHTLVCDLHPEYLSSKWARAEASHSGLPLTEVQHHHAHIASVLGEHELFGPSIGIAFDGTGFGADDAIWGGEVLIANCVDYERFANFTYVPMPGAAACVKHPLRMAYGMLWAYDLLDHPGAKPALDALGAQAEICKQMIEADLNTPYTSSVGRLFDTISALLGICTESTYEGEPAIMLDAVRTKQSDNSNILSCDTGIIAPGKLHDKTCNYATEDARYEVTLTKNSATSNSTAHDTSVILLDAGSLLKAVLDDAAAGIPVSEISIKFHWAIVDAIIQVADLARTLYDINLVALSGGCFMNRFLLEESVRELDMRGFTVAVNSSLPPNDGCVSFGQAIVGKYVSLESH